MGSLPNMLRSILVMAVLVGVVIAIVPRSDEVKRPTVEVAEVASRVPAEWQALVPNGLPDTYRPIVAGFDKGTGDLMTFTTVWQVPNGDLSLRQALAPSAQWLQTTTGCTSESRTLEPVAAKGRTWERCVPREGQTAYTWRADGAKGLTAVVLSDAPEAETLAMLQSLAPSAATKAA